MNNKKNKLALLPKNVTRGTGNVKQVLKLFGLCKKDPNRLTANQIRALCTERLERRIEERRNKK